MLAQPLPQGIFLRPASGKDQVQPRVTLAWIETWSGTTVTGGEEVVVDAPLHLIPVWVRAGSIIVTYPAHHIASGLGEETPGAPLEATLWGEPACGCASARLADGTRVGWRRGAWSVSAEREVTFRVLG